MFLQWVHQGEGHIHRKPTFPHEAHSSTEAMHITFAYIPHSYLSTLLVTHSFCAFAFGRQLAQWAATGNYAMWRIQYNLWHSRAHPLPTNEKKHNYPTSKNNCILFSHLTLCLNHNSKGRIPGRRGSYLQHLVSCWVVGNLAEYIYTYLHMYLWSRLTSNA